MKKLLLFVIKSAFYNLVSCERKEAVSSAKAQRTQSSRFPGLLCGLCVPERNVSRPALPFQIVVFLRLLQWSTAPITKANSKETRLYVGLSLQKSATDSGTLVVFLHLLAFTARHHRRQTQGTRFFAPPHAGIRSHPRLNHPTQHFFDRTKADERFITRPQRCGPRRRSR